MTVHIRVCERGHCIECELTLYCGTISTISHSQRANSTSSQRRQAQIRSMLGSERHVNCGAAGLPARRPLRQQRPRLQTGRLALSSSAQQLTAMGLQRSVSRHTLLCMHPHRAAVHPPRLWPPTRTKWRVPLWHSHDIARRQRLDGNARCMVHTRIGVQAGGAVDCMPSKSGARSMLSAPRRQKSHPWTSQQASPASSQCPCRMAVTCRQRPMSWRCACIA